MAGVAREREAVGCGWAKCLLIAIAVAVGWAADARRVGNGVQVVARVARPLARVGRGRIGVVGVRRFVGACDRRRGHGGTVGACAAWQARS